MDPKDGIKQEESGDLLPNRPYWPWSFMVILTLLLYVLSIGPAARIARTGLVPEPILEAFYTPVIWICSASSTFGDLIFIYICLWGG